MCKPSDNQQTATNGAPATITKNLVVVGAGPAGLLLSLQFMQRNIKCAGENNVQYKVTLVDASTNYGELDEAALKAHHRSWMISLASHGLDAIRDSDVPDLYEKYVSSVGIPIKAMSIYLGSKEIRNQGNPDDVNKEDVGEAFIVDRNFIVAALARCLTEQYGSNSLLDMKYNSKVLFVDAENHRLLVRTTDGQSEEYIPYDLLVGCDGFRSAVRESLVRSHREFECDVGDIFQYFKAVHIRRPKAVHSEGMSVLPSCLPSMQGIALPEKGDMVNMTIGAARSDFDQLHDDIKSSDPKVVAAYMREKFKAFELEDYDDFAQQWVDMKRWQRTGQVHCNTYHSSEHDIVIMGDAAHATSPTIGMGMNTALADASVFHQLLDKHKDNLSLVLPAFSEERVKEGNALTDLAMHLYCLEPRAQMIETIHLVLRPILHKWLPWLVSRHPQELIGLTKYKLSDVYRLANKLGIIQKHRYLNDMRRRQFFEQQIGLKEKSSNQTNWMKVFCLGGILAVVAAMAVKM